ncbi:TcfC E-set like domain-containing protein [Rahnella sp. LAC-M12]|uniref:TcfC E-set like domain-containing protein n=2 Tax=Yersiniaceae TaxID=1903411 RepID=A0ABS0E2C6_9GAMM|nr:TcfC E-set like domain-containing protein [Rahnella sp. LAC-M12]MBF7979197.1 TcfC E-set like domain-containing protein [Rahnella laticis]MBF7999538.1 TcfC E-set like domain-containing protein [Rahnella sp. LAC-M12]
MLCSLLPPAYASVRVPDGFEELARGQDIVADVDLYGQPLGTVRVHVDLENVTFLQPDVLSAAVKKLYGDAPALNVMLESKIRQALRRNGDLSCSTNGHRVGCDYLKTDSLGLIYDENNAVIHLFLGEQYAPLTREDARYYQASPEIKNALVHQQNVNFATSGRYQSLSVQGNGALGVGDSSYLGVDWNWLAQRSGEGTAQQIEAPNAYFRQDFLKRIYLQAGLMNSQDIYTNAGGNIALTQLPLGRIRGVRAGSTLAWVNRETVSAGTPVNVLLTRDARVDAYRNNQLLTSFYLKAGAQALDTRSFPAGSYTLTLNIYENNQLVRTETQLYSRQGQGWGNDFQWFLQAGVPDEQNALTTNSVAAEHYVVHAGGRLPLTESAALTTGVALFSSARYVESALDWSHGFNSGPLDGQLTTRVSWLQGSDGSRGSTQQVSYNDGFSLSVYRTSLTSEDCNMQQARAYGFTGCYTNTNAMFSVPLAGWNGTLGYSLSSNEGRYVYRRDLSADSEEVSAGAPWDQVYQSRSRSQTWQTGLNRTFVLSNLNVGVGLSAFASRSSGYNGMDKGFYLSFSLSGVSRNDSGGRSAASAGASWQQSRSGESQLGYNASYTRYSENLPGDSVSASLNGINTDTVNALAQVRGDSQYGSGSLAVSDAWNTQQNVHTTGSSGSYSSSLIADSDGVALGGWAAGGASSALAVKVDANEDDSRARVTVAVGSGGRRDIGGGGRGIFLMPGYEKTTYSVNEALATPGGVSSEIRKGTGRGSIFMPPGKVLSKTVEVSTRYLWLGRLLDEQRRPLEGGIPLNVAAWTPVGNGGFTMETDRKISTLYLMRDDHFWQCRIKVRAVRDVIRYLGATSCQDTDMARLPPAEQRQVELMSAGVRRDAKPVAVNGQQHSLEH